MYAVKNGLLADVVRGETYIGSVVWDKGVILAAGADVEIPSEAEVIDAAGKWVTPGFVEAHCHISMASSPNNYNTRIDLNEWSDPVTPYLMAADSINPRDLAIAKAREVGFTTVCTLPGSSNVIGGNGICLKLKEAQTAAELIIPGTEMFKMAFGENPKRFFGDNKKAPVTRMAVAALVRETFCKAQEYAEKRRIAEEKSERPPFDFRLHQMLPVLTGERKVRIHCHRSDDIVSAISIAEEFGLTYSLEHVTEGWMIKDFLKEKKPWMVLDPLAMEPTKFETQNISWKNPAVMEEAGLEFSLMQDTGYNTYLLPLYVGKCIAEGLSEIAALRALTIWPAKNLGLDARLGSLEAGKDADIAVFSGHPFSAMSRCEMTVIDGRIYRS